MLTYANVELDIVPARQRRETLALDGRRSPSPTRLRWSLEMGGCSNVPAGRIAAYRGCQRAGRSLGKTRAGMKRIGLECLFAPRQPVAEATVLFLPRTADTPCSCGR
ncbi:hypothetical protein AcV5_002321 [Taiwanofungus camphoratus]|nr:hypothetical protein AcV5_002321 [Antrodia cinnamomea]